MSLMHAPFQQTVNSAFAAVSKTFGILFVPLESLDCMYEERFEPKVSVITRIVSISTTYQPTFGFFY